jgi:TonB family protein
VRGDSGGAGAGDANGGDLRAACLACPAPGYPRQAERRGWEGSVDLRLRIDAAGRVTEVAVVRASGFQILDDAAVAAARESRFRLGDDERRAGGVWGRMRYRFELGG